MDEPTSSLDYGNQIRVLSQIKKLAGEGYTVVLSTHNPDQAFLFADRVLALSDGRVLLHGRPNDVISDELLKRLYNIDVEVHSLYMDRVRVCVPISMIGRVGV
jgi:iron complex transport system ATP-binding protein